MCDYKVLSYNEFGSGENILFLHGWGSGKSLWGNLLDLSADYHIWCVDLWGFGDTPTPQKVVNSLDYAQGIVDFIENVIKSKVILIGHSFGGKIASIIAAKTKLVSKLILIASAGAPRRFSLKRYVAKIKYKRAKKKVELGKVSKSYLNRFGSSDYKNSSGIMRAILVECVNENIVKLAFKIKVPTLLVWGRQDSTTPLYMAKTMRKAIKNSSLVVVRGGHFCFLDSNILPTIYKFLESGDD